MRDWFSGHGQPAPVPGVTDSLSNSPAPRRTGQLASGHALTDSPPGGDPHDPGRVDVHDWNQTLSPRPLASLCTVNGDGPIASSIHQHQHQGRATVQVLDQATAANPTLGPQLGSRAPSGNPNRPADHTTPSGMDQAARTPGPAYLGDARYGQRPAGYTMYPSRTAPGE